MKDSKKNKGRDEPVKTRPAVAASAPPDRRNFMTRAAAVVVGGIVALFPPLAGLAMFLDPLKRKSQAGQFIHVADLDEVPPDGIPRRIRVPTYP